HVRRNFFRPVVLSTGAVKRSLVGTLPLTALGRKISPAIFLLKTRPFWISIKQPGLELSYNGWFPSKAKLILFVREGGSRFAGRSHHSSLARVIGGENVGQLDKYANCPSVSVHQLPAFFLIADAAGRWPSPSLRTKRHSGAAHAGGGHAGG